MAVREIESWLLADRQGFARFSGAPLPKIPSQPEALLDPKQTLLQLIRRYGARAIKREILPAAGIKARVGMGYNQCLEGFARGSWSPERAAEIASSLAGTRKRLRELGARERNREPESTILWP